MRTGPRSHNTQGGRETPRHGDTRDTPAPATQESGAKEREPGVGGPGLDRWTLTHQTEREMKLSTIIYVDIEYSYNLT